MLHSGRGRIEEFVGKDFVSLAGASTSLLLSRQTHICRDKICLLSRQNVCLPEEIFYCDKIMFMATKNNNNKEPVDKPMIISIFSFAFSMTVAQGCVGPRVQLCIHAGGQQKQGKIVQQ